MRTVALLTDFGDKDNFVGVMKGVILSIAPRTQIVDISHNVSAGNIKEAAFLLVKSFKYFPKKTIFVVVVDPGVGSSRKAIVAKSRDYYFIAPDNGVLSWVLDNVGDFKIVQIQNKKFISKNVSSTFHGRDIFAPVAGYLSKGIDIERIGRRISSIKKISFPHPYIEKGILLAEILYIDRFGNLITNLSKEEFLRFIKGGKFVADLNGKKIREIRSYYFQKKDKKPFFIEGSFSLLEISLRSYSAEKYFKAKSGDKVYIQRQ